MTQTEESQASPAFAASQSSWRCVQAHDREGWLALMSDDVVIEDPIGKSVTNPDGTGVRGKEAVGAFFDAHTEPPQPRAGSGDAVALLQARMRDVADDGRRVGEGRNGGEGQAGIGNGTHVAVDTA